MTASYVHQVVFGDCDPAGIVYYPQMFGWMDAGFHRWLAHFGGHGAICNKLSISGIGVASAQAQFKRPLTDGDKVQISIQEIEWSRKSVTLEYAGTIGDIVHFTGTEVRCMFVKANDGIRAGEVAPLKALLT